MKQHIKLMTVAIAVVVCSAMILSRSGVASALMTFFLVGALPGTTYSLPPALMLLIIALTAWLLLFRMTAVSLISFLRIDTLARKQLYQKNRLPKRRFGQIN